MKNNTIDVSVIIVCMNNLNMLYPCLNSIKEYTKEVSYEVLVTAYLFSKENLDKAKRDFPWVTFIESNEIRGFSENNNLALRQAKGKYCFVVNDDTFQKEHVIDKLYIDFEKLPQNIAVVSPTVLRSDGSIQHCGRPKLNAYTFLLDCLRLLKTYEKKSKYCHQTGIFKTYNIHGACFMIRTKLFKDLGWFDEKYFFCPEDVALSTHLNEMGYLCFVDSDIHIFHIGGGTWSKTSLATKPAEVRGNVLFYRELGTVQCVVYIISATILYLSNSLVWICLYLILRSEKLKVKANSNWHGLLALFSNQTPKQLFTKYYLHK